MGVKLKCQNCDQTFRPLRSLLLRQKAPVSPISCEFFLLVGGNLSPPPIIYPMDASPPPPLQLQLDPLTAIVTSLVLYLALCYYNKQQRRHQRQQPPQHQPTNDTDSPTNYFPPVGTLRSCFRECRGTPRQGSFAPSTRGYIQFNKSIPADSLEGLTGFTHVWIVFVFHKNTNLHHSRKAHQSKSGQHSFRSKVKPPKLNGKSVGVFATRTPHRPNAIGITLARVESVQGRRVILSALDLLDGTPILDIKPYVTPYDSVAHAGIPQWCGTLPPQAEADASMDERIHFADEATQTIDEAASQGELRFYDQGIDVRRAIAELLLSDVRPAKAYRGSKARSDDLCHFRFDMLLVGFVRHPTEHIVASVVDIQVESERMDKALQAGTKVRYARR